MLDIRDERLIAALHAKGRRLQAEVFETKGEVMKYLVL